MDRSAYESQRLLENSGLMKATTSLAPNQVFRDPANKTEEAWRVLFNGAVLPPSWNSKGAAQTHLNLLEYKTQRGIG